MEYVCDARKMSGLPASMEMDNVPALLRLGFARVIGIKRTNKI
ncbi:MAG: hypothetical protein WKF71_04905 [Pyrinomonadaceae bacterium]